VYRPADANCDNSGLDDSS